MCWYKTQKFCFHSGWIPRSFANIKSLLWGYYSFGLRILLGLKLTISIVARGDIVGIRPEREGVGENLQN